MEFNYIVSTPSILGGKPCIKGTRISVELILETVASGASLADIHQEFPQLSIEALQEAIRYAALLTRNPFWQDITLAA
ncbi:DUF433 domain-containing protein [Larkinella terrae]|uniref:DUF433 domain-containing protein n=1 Tax=Larkinella terrae TaxID=2025311 RepID=A0A7K0EXI5_9BACT|nr:DUF433 domain-containing protein [Larkinella terrae]MRS65888.1 DUF433 domain-containing protein [Larkinella terrae]